MWKILTVLVGSLFAAVASAQQQVESLDLKPLTEVVKGQLKPVKVGRLKVPVNTWGGDVATIHAEREGLFRAEGLEVSLFVENEFPKQLQGFLNGETPYLRGILGQLNAAAESVSRSGTELVVIYQLTWSVGGDALVVRSDVKAPVDLKGKVIGAQIYGPHPEFLSIILANAGLKPEDVKIRWFRDQHELINEGKKITDPVSAFRAQKDMSAVLAISPDATSLTSRERGVKDVKVLLTTKTASRVICDVYAVRKDYLDANRASVEKFVRANLKGEESLRELIAGKVTYKAKYNDLLKASATLLLDSPTATADVEGMIGDAEFTGHTGNVAFFEGRNTTRTLRTLNDEIQAAFIGLGIMERRVELKGAGWDYSKLGHGLKNTSVVTSPVFDPAKVRSSIETRVTAETTKWQEDGTLFLVEIQFAPNQAEFSTEKYRADFEKAMRLSQTFAGAIVVIEGHSDPLGILKAREARKSDSEIAEMERAAKNLSLIRAEAVRKSYLESVKAMGQTVDESQFVAVGLGVKTPKFLPPRTSEEWAANRRVVFRVRQIEAEAAEFTPLSK